MVFMLSDKNPQNTHRGPVIYEICYLAGSDNTIGNYYIYRLAGDASWDTALGIRYHKGFYSVENSGFELYLRCDYFQDNRFNFSILDYTYRNKARLTKNVYDYSVQEITSFGDMLDELPASTDTYFTGTFESLYLSGRFFKTKADSADQAGTATLANTATTSNNIFTSVGTGEYAPTDTSIVAGDKNIVIVKQIPQPASANTIYIVVG